MNYKGRLAEYNTKLSDLYEQIEQLPTLKTTFSFKGERAKAIEIDCDRPNNVVVTADKLKDGNIHQLPSALVMGATEIASAYYNDRVYLFGGWTRENTPNLLTTISYYDLKTKQIHKCDAQLPVNISGQMTYVYNDSIYLLGGYSSAVGIQDTIYKYNPSTDTPHDSTLKTSYRCSQWLND